MVHFHDQGFACHPLSIPARDSVDLEKNPLAMFMQKHREGVQAFFGTGICVQSLHKRAGLDGVDLLLQDKTLGADLVDLVGGERLRLNLLPVRQLREAQLHPLAYLQRPQISVGLQQRLEAVVSATVLRGLMEIQELLQQPRWQLLSSGVNKRVT